MNIETGDVIRITNPVWQRFGAMKVIAFDPEGKGDHLRPHPAKNSQDIYLPISYYNERGEVEVVRKGDKDDG